MIARVLKAGLIYFAIVFGVGFFLGMLRVPFLVPALGERTAELIELPFMLAAIFFAARWVVGRYSFKGDLVSALSVGIIAALVLLVVEFSVVLWLRGLSIIQFLESRDSIAAVLYYSAVGVFGLMPAILTSAKRSRIDE